MIEALIKNESLQARFQLAEQLVFHDGVGRLLKTMLRVILHSFENQRIKSSFLDNFVKFNEPLIKLVLLLNEQVIRGQVLDQLLEGAHHVPKEAHSDHLHK